VIVVEELRKRYGEVQALDGVSFEVREGEVFGLLGPNGAGKSTTVRVLVTLTHADEGRASVAGHDVRSEPNAVRRAIGYVPQDSGVDQFGTGRENLMLQGRVQGMSGRDLSARASGSSSSASPTPPIASSRTTRAECGGASTSRSA
jgi:ABC-2 type transport system ATP-binding protein